MTTKENSLDKQIQQWALVGPFIMMVILTVLLITPLHQPFYIPCISLLGILLSWRWKLRGLTVALGCLGTLLIYQLWNDPIEHIFWNLMVVTALALTFTITTLCGQEVEEILAEIQEESTTNLHNFLGLNERMHNIENQKRQEINALIAETKALELQLEEKCQHLETCQRALSVSQEKMTSISNQNESLLRELFQKRHEYDKLSQKEALSQQKIDDLLAAEEEYKREIDQLQKSTSNHKAHAPSKEHIAPVTTEKKLSSKPKNGKPSKTNHWANAILSRWSESDALSQ